jgi:hypothetical protein
MTYKYFLKTDKKKETVGTVSAPSSEIAYEMAAQLKRLALQDFIEIFKIEKLKRHGK